MTRVARKRRVLPPWKQREIARRKFARDVLAAFKDASLHFGLSARSPLSVDGDRLDERVPGLEHPGLDVQQPVLQKADSEDELRDVPSPHVGVLGDLIDHPACDGHCVEVDAELPAEVVVGRSKIVAHGSPSVVDGPAEPTDGAL